MQELVVDRREIEEQPKGQALQLKLRPHFDIPHEEADELMQRLKFEASADAAPGAWRVREKSGARVEEWSVEPVGG